MAKKVVASLKDRSGVKYAKLIRSVKSEKTGAYTFKEEIVMEDYVKDILAGKSQQDIIDELRAKIKNAAEKYYSDVVKGKFPGRNNTYI